jgi:tRNA splicing ligase
VAGSPESEKSFSIGYKFSTLYKNDHLWRESVKVKEIRELVSSLQKEGNFNQKTVEFVVDTKKYFAEDIKAGVDTMAFSVTRENYRPLTLDQLASALEVARGDLEVEVLVGKNRKVVSGSYPTASALELIVE